MFLEGQDAMVAFWLSSSFAEWSFIRQVATNHESVACCGMLVKHGQTMSIGPFFSVKFVRILFSHKSMSMCCGSLFRWYPASLWDEPQMCRFNSTRTRAAAPQGEGADCRNSETLRRVNFPNIFHRESSKGTLR